MRKITPYPAERVSSIPGALGAATIMVAIAVVLLIAIGAAPAFAGVPSGLEASQPPPPGTEETDSESESGEAEKGEALPVPGPPGAGPPGEETPLQILSRIGDTLREVEGLMAKLTWDGEIASGQEQVLQEIDKLLDDAGKEQKQVLSDIDRLIDMAQKQCKSGNFSQQSLGQSSSQQKPQQQSPQQNPDSSQSEGEQKPENQQGTGQQESPQKSEQESGGRKPNDPSPEKSWNEDVNGRWGSLPPKLQELIRQGDPSKFPPQYREMLEEYYKRLSDREK